MAYEREVSTPGYAYRLKLPDGRTAVGEVLTDGRMRVTSPHNELAGVYPTRDIFNAVEQGLISFTAETPFPTTGQSVPAPVAPAPIVPTTRLPAPTTGGGGLVAPATPPTGGSSLPVGGVPTTTPTTRTP